MDGLHLIMGKPLTFDLGTEGMGFGGRDEWKNSGDAMSGIGGGGDR